MKLNCSHFLSCITEMLTFFICIFFLKQWLQFDLFKDALWTSPEMAIYNNNNNTKLKSLKSKRFWKRKNRSRSPSRSVGRSEISETFTSSEDDLSSISIDDVSSSCSSESETDENAVEIIELPNSDEEEDSFHSSIIVESDDEVSSIDSQLSWFQDHYCYADTLRYLLC